MFSCQVLSEWMFGLFTSCYLTVGKTDIKTVRWIYILLLLQHLFPIKSRSNRYSSSVHIMCCEFEWSDGKTGTWLAPTQCLCCIATSVILVGKLNTSTAEVVCYEFHSVNWSIIGGVEFGLTGFTYLKITSQDTHVFIRGLRCQKFVTVHGLVPTTVWYIFSTGTRLVRYKN